MRKTTLATLVSTTLLTATTLFSCGKDSPEQNVIFRCEEYTVYTDSIAFGTSTTIAVSDSEAAVGDTLCRIPVSKPTASRYLSPHKLINFAYNIATSEIAGEIDSAATSTRAVAYSVCLSLAYLHPERSMELLRERTKDGRIIQDDGTGGSWPVTSDRMIWILAAWEVYKATGDREWLAEALAIAERSMADDMMVTLNPEYNLMHGEQSCLGPEWGTYPKWMHPKDIFETMSLSTNVIFSRAFGIMAKMAELSGRDGTSSRTMADKIATAINDYLWIPNLGYYSEYLYGGVYPLQSQTADNLGQALALLSDISTPEMARSVMTKTPRTQFGTTSLFPQPAGASHGNGDGVRPFVQAFWNLAAAKTGHGTALDAGLGSILRSNVMAAPNREGNGHNAAQRNEKMMGNSGMAAMILRVIAGMELHSDRLEFKPVVPAALTGKKILAGVRYRQATLDVSITGTGNTIAGFSVDGRDTTVYAIADTTTGHHTIAIVMANNIIDKEKIRITDRTWMPPTAQTEWTTRRHAEIANYQAGLDYEIYLNGSFREEITTNDFDLYEAPRFTVVDIVPVADDRWVGYSARPYLYFPDGSLTIVEAEKFATPGTRFIKDKKWGAKFVEISPLRNTRLPMETSVDEGGDYFIDVRYANGAGSATSGNHCAVRTLFVNGERVGAIVMPQRGDGVWISTGFSNMLPVKLKPGINQISLDYVTPYNVNMGGKANTALIDYVRVIKK